VEVVINIHAILYLGKRPVSICKIVSDVSPGIEERSREVSSKYACKCLSTTQHTCKWDPSTSLCV
jgi:hypothetical protein